MAATAPRKLFLEWARDAYLNHYKHFGNGQGESNTRLKGHRQDLCKMCVERGHLCTLRRRDSSKKQQEPRKQKNDTHNLSSKRTAQQSSKQQ